MSQWREQRERQVIVESAMAAIVLPGGAVITVRANPKPSYESAWFASIGSESNESFETLAEGQAWALANLPAKLRKLADDIEALAKETP